MAYVEKDELEEKQMQAGVSVTWKLQNLCDSWSLDNEFENPAYQLRIFIFSGHVVSYISVIPKSGFEQNSR